MIKRILCLSLLIIGMLLFQGCFSSITLENKIKFEDSDFTLTREPDSLTAVKTIETNGNLFKNSLSFYRGYLFAAEYSGRIYAFDLETLKEDGYASTRNTSITSSPVFAGDFMYYLYKKKQNPGFQLVKYNIVKGKEVSDSKIGAMGKGELFKIEGRLVVVAESGIYILDTLGSLIKKFEVNGSISADPLQFEDKIVAGLTTGEILELDATKNEISYFKSGSSEVITTFFPVGDNYLAGFEGGGLKLIGRSGYEFWSVKTGRVNAVPVISNGEVIFGDLSGMLYRVSLKTGELKNSYQTGGMIDLKVFATTSKIIVPLTDGKIILFDRVTLKPIQEIGTEGRIRTGVINFRNFLFIGHDNGKILVIQI